MKHLITLCLSPTEDTLRFVKQLTGLKELEIDEVYGLVPISLKRNLYTIRVSGNFQTDKLMANQPKIKGIYPDIKVSSIKSNTERGD